MPCFFFFNDTATTEIYTLSLHDALPIYRPAAHLGRRSAGGAPRAPPPRGAQRRHPHVARLHPRRRTEPREDRSAEHTSELQSRQYLLCRLLPEKLKKKIDSV